MKLRLVATIALLVLVESQSLAAMAGIAPLNLAVTQGREPIVDYATGNRSYIVDLVENLQDQFPGTISIADRDRFGTRPTPQSINLVKSYETKYGFQHTAMTSWVGNSFTAFLTQEQVDALRRDPNVIRVTEDTLLDSSVVGPPWYDTTHSSSQPPYTETSSWGRNAVNGKLSNNAVRVYIIDTGVGFHQDLTNVIARVNASCGTNNNGWPGHTAVGCYPHATHVAGIIGAAYGNKGVAGVDAGAKIIGVDIDTYDASPAVCSVPYETVSSMATGMDYVKWDLIVNGRFMEVGIVSISMNGPDFAPGGTLNPKMLSLATRFIGGIFYGGAFIVQSAGNNYADACGYAFGYSNKTPNAADGILVVGGVDNLGNAVVPGPNGANGYVNQPYAGDELGSNYGSCVEVWAPSKSILSTWGPNVGYDPSNQATWQKNSTTYNNYVYLSGTSMAAPHSAGVAAYLAETQSLGDSGAIEAAVRNLFFTTGQVDHNGLALKQVQLP